MGHKMMQRALFLGCAAALAAVTVAQAADLPVKAKPVEYVKVCSIYGAGFWYVPGTDTCLKIGSYIRTQAEWGASDGGIPLGAGNAFGRTNRVENVDFAFRFASVDLGRPAHPDRIRHAALLSRSRRSGHDRRQCHGRRHRHHGRRGVRRSRLRAVRRLHGRPHPVVFRHQLDVAPTPTATRASTATPARLASSAGPTPPSSAMACLPRCHSRTRASPQAAAAGSRLTRLRPRLPSTL